MIPFKAQTIPPDIAMRPIPRIDSGIAFVNNAVSSILPAATDGSILNPLMPVSMSHVDKEPHLAGTVTEVYDNFIPVSVQEGEDARRSSDLAVTLEDVRTLSKKGDGLLFEDFQKYKGANASSGLGYYIMVYGVEGGYRLIVCSNQGGKPDSVNLESVWESSGSGIDIRYGDIDVFLSKRPVIMQVKDGTATPYGVTVTLKNVAETEYTYGDGYAIQRKTDNGWIDVEPIIENYGFNSIGYMLPAMESEEIIIGWERLYGKLPTGDYRIVKEALFARSPGGYGTFALYAAFTIGK